MAEYEDREVAPHHGPALVMTTQFLKKSPRRIALRTQSLAIPGTYELSKVIGAGVGLFAGLFLGVPLYLITGTWLALVVFATLGALGGIFIVSWSPLKGESILKWFVLHTAKRNQLISQGGGYARAYVGGAVVRRSLFKNAQMVKAYVEADPEFSAPAKRGKSSKKNKKNKSKNVKLPSRRDQSTINQNRQGYGDFHTTGQLPTLSSIPAPQYDTRLNSNTSIRGG